MALRPVSELGLVDLTDLASPPAPATTKRRRPDGDPPKKASRRSGRSEGAPRAKSRRPERNESAPRAKSLRSALADASADAAAEVKRPAPDRASGPRKSRALAQKVGISLTCVVAGVAGIMLGRAAVHS
jgi:hypothetical protein